EAEDRNEDCELSEQQAAVGRPRVRIACPKGMVCDDPFRPTFPRNNTGSNPERDLAVGRVSASPLPRARQGCVTAARTGFARYSPPLDRHDRGVVDHRAPQREPDRIAYLDRPTNGRRRRAEARRPRGQKPPEE